MEYRFESSLEYLAIKEPSLHELYQSVKPAVPADATIAAKECEAFICSEKEKSQVLVYLAFRETSAKKIRIFTPALQPRSIREYEVCIDDAKNYLHQLGFVMNRVNLDYSTAMRQVIWGSVAVFKAPKVYAKAAKAEKAAHQTATVSQTAKPVADPPASISKPTRTEVQTAVPVPESLPAAADLQPQLEQAQDEVKRLQKKLNVLQHAQDEEKNYLEGEIASLKEQLAVNAPCEIVNEVDVSPYVAEIAGLTAELDRLRQALASRESELSAAQERIEAEIQARTEAEGEHESSVHTLENERDSLAQLLQAEQARSAGLAAEIDECAAAHSTAISDYERLLAVATELKECAEAALQQSVEEKNRIEQVAIAGLESARLDRQVLVARFEEQEQEQQALIEKQRGENIALCSALELALSETEKLKRELMINKRVASREQAALRAELRRVITADALENQSLSDELDDEYEPVRPVRPVFTAPVSPPLAAVSEPVPEVNPLQLARKTSHAEAPLAIEAPVIAEQPLPFASEADSLAACSVDDTYSTMTVYSSIDSDATEFKPEQKLKVVPVDSPDDLYALYESANKVQAVPDGFRVQRSGGYVCAVNHGGRRDIYLVWQMLESRQTQVYAPTNQPADEESFQKVLQDALYYFDSIGFMMSPVELDNAPHRLAALEKLGHTRS